MIYKAWGMRRHVQLPAHVTERVSFHRFTAARGHRNRNANRDDDDDEEGIELEEGKRHSHSAAMHQLRSLNEEFGISLQGDPSPEVILRDLDPQSMILCGLSGNFNNS